MSHSSGIRSATIWPLFDAWPRGNSSLSGRIWDACESHGSEAGDRNREGFRRRFGDCLRSWVRDSGWRPSCCARGIRSRCNRPCVFDFSGLSSWRRRSGCGAGRSARAQVDGVAVCLQQVRSGVQDRAGGTACRESARTGAVAVWASSFRNCGSSAPRRTSSGSRK